MSKRCSGRTKFNSQCTRYVLEDLCWEHAVESPKTEQTRGYDELIGETLNTLTKDKENVHTKPVQRGVQKAIQAILEWGNDIEPFPNLPELVSNKLPAEPSTTQIKAYNHLLDCYDITDTVTLFDTTYPKLCSLVWHRIQGNPDLIERFYEEVSESEGLCLNGNMSRLMNVFAGIDHDFSPQDVSLSKTQFHEQVSKALLLTPIECMNKVIELCKEAELSDIETQEWIYHVTIFFCV
jgi:hypothetical protein